MKKKIIFLFTIILTLGTSVFATENTKVFTDLDSSHWAYSAVNQMVKDGVVNGYADNTFRPDQEITRAEFAKMFSVALDINYEDENIGYYPFMDNVDEFHWAYSYIQSTYMYFPKTNDYNGSFEPDKYITREDAAYIFVERILPNVNSDGALDIFSDANEISETKKNNVSLAVASGIMNGNGNGTLNPNGNLTRAQVCTLINNVKYKLKICPEYLKINEILKCTEITTNLNGEEKNKVNIELIMDVPSIKEARVLVSGKDGYIWPSITYGKTENENYPNMYSIKMSFYAETENNYRINIDKISTLDGKSTYGTAGILLHTPFNRLYMEYDNEIDKDTEFKFDWSVQYGTPSKHIEWYLTDSNISGTIEDKEFSIAEDIIKTSKKKLPKELNVMLVAEDDTYYENSLRIYKYNIFDINNPKGINSNVDIDNEKNDDTNKNDSAVNNDEKVDKVEKDPREDFVNWEKVDFLVELGIMDKDKDGTFKPSGIPTNHEAVKFVTNLMNYGVEANGYFYMASQKNFFANLSEDKFVADESNITYQEFVTLVLNAMGYAPSIMGGNENQYWMRANEIGLLKGMTHSNIDRNSIITREFVSNILYNALNAPMYERIEGNNMVTYKQTEKSLYEIRFK